MKISLKEARETYVCLKIIERAALFGESDMIEQAKDEADQIIRILVKGISTTRKNL